MQINPGNIVKALLKDFPDSDESPLTRQEEKAICILKLIITRFLEDQDLEMKEDTEICCEYSEENGNVEVSDLEDDFPTTDMFKFGNRMVPADQVRAAIEFYRKPAQNYRSLNSMNSRYRFIKTGSDLDKLREIETLGLFFFLCELNSYMNYRPRERRQKKITPNSSRYIEQ